MLRRQHAGWHGVAPLSVHCIAAAIHQATRRVQQAGCCSCLRTAALALAAQARGWTLNWLAGGASTIGASAKRLLPAPPAAPPPLPPLLPPHPWPLLLRQGRFAALGDWRAGCSWLIHLLPLLAGVSAGGRAGSGRAAAPSRMEASLPTPRLPVHALPLALAPMLLLSWQESHCGHCGATVGLTHRRGSMPPPLRGTCEPTTTVPAAASSQRVDSLHAVIVAISLVRACTPKRRSRQGNGDTAPAAVPAGLP